MIEIARVVGLATVQDAGRPGSMHMGVPRGGAMIPERLARANAAARNRLDAAAIEAFGHVSLVARAPLLLGLGDGASHALEAGERLDVPAARAHRATYIAVRGGIDVPRVLGGRGTLLVAALGGYHGRSLRKGDLLPVGRDPEVRDTSAAGGAGGAGGAGETDVPVIHVVPGPDFDAFAAEALGQLFGAEFVVSSASDRTGTRLRGPRIARLRAEEQEARPMVRGAIEVTASGEAIVLGPDHPTTGGYPLVGVVVDRDFGRIMGAPLGSALRFSA